MKRLIRLLGFLAVFYVLINMATFLFQEKLIFLSERLPHDYTYSFNEPFEELNLDSEDGASINVLYFRAEQPVGIVVYFHGNAGNLSKWGEIAPQFTSRNHDVIMMDYRGYGKSKGERSENAFYEDALLLYAKAMTLHPETNITVFGRSLGTTFATYVAAKHNPQQLVLESPFYSMERLVKKRYPYLPVDALLKYKFRTNHYMQSVHCPVTIIHGTEDRVVPIASAKKLFGAIPQKNRSFITIENGAHNNLNTFSEYSDALDTVIDP